MLSCPLIFLHGFLGSKKDWDPVISHLPYECIALDLTLEPLQIDIPRFHLIGYSMGGRISLAYAAQHPEQIASLTLISTHFGLTTEEEKKQRLAHDAKWAALLETNWEEFIKKWYDQPIFNGFRPHREKPNLSIQKNMLLHYSLGKQQRYEPKNAHIIVGEHDAKFRALHPTATIIPNAGHAVHLENPEAVARELETKINH
jgi:2-succinyl-6-hydroxy-2,4-cyclohexadiene-1-carboxylate synthase